MYNVLCATGELGKEIYDITRVLVFFKIPALNQIDRKHFSCKGLYNPRMNSVGCPM